MPNTFYHKWKLVFIYKRTQSIIPMCLICGEKNPLKIRKFELKKYMCM